MIGGGPGRKERCVFNKDQQLHKTKLKQGEGNSSRAMSKTTYSI